MIKIKPNTNRVFMTKGDNAEIKISIVDGNGKERKIFADDIIEFSVKEISGKVVIRKKAVNGVISLVPDDTKQLPVGTYKFDVQLKTFTNKIYTIVQASNFEIGEEITV